VPAAAVLRGGDVLQAVDGHPVTSASELRRLIRAHRPGDVVRLTIVRGGATRTVNVRTVATGTGADRHAAVGITPDLLATFDKPKVRFGISPSEVGGPSAGLMFTLGLIDKLSGQQLTGGRTIAGTGTIDGFGLVGPIGGIQQKIAAATSKRVGATVFLAPAGDCAEAKAAAPAGVTLVRVDTLKTALSALRAIRSGSEAFPRC
jgi:PDZ domain-containing protein